MAQPATMKIKLTKRGAFQRTTTVAGEEQRPRARRRPDRQSPSENRPCPRSCWTHPVHYPRGGAARCARPERNQFSVPRVREIMIFLHSHGVSTARAVRIFKTYGTGAIQVMSENPCRLARDIRGIGFKTADAIAAKLGIEKTALIRVRAGISYALTEAMDEGHCGLPTDQLVPLAEKLLEVPQLSIVVWFNRAYQYLGLNGCSSHSGRRTFITRAARLVHEAGGSLRDVQLLAGHRSIQTTQRYIDGDTDAQRKLVSMI
jgi:Helix-hairpin-helix containing domain